MKNLLRFEPRQLLALDVSQLVEARLDQSPDRVVELPVLIEAALRSRFRQELLFHEIGELPGILAVSRAQRAEVRFETLEGAPYATRPDRASRPVR